MEQKPKRTGGARIIDFAARKTEFHRKDVRTEAKEMINALSGALLNSASEAATYGDKRTHIALEALRTAYEPFAPEDANPGAEALQKLEQTLAYIKNESETVRKAKDLLRIIEDTMRNAESPEEEQAMQWGHALLSAAYEKTASHDGLYDPKAYQELERVVSALRSLVEPAPEQNPSGTVTPYRKKA